MAGWHVALIIILVLGVIVSNLMLLRYSAKFKTPNIEDLKDPVKKLREQAKENAKQDGASSQREAEK